MRGVASDGRLQAEFGRDRHGLYEMPRTANIDRGPAESGDSRGFVRHAATGILFAAAVCALYLYPPVGICVLALTTGLYLLNRFSTAALLLWLCALPVDAAPRLSDEQMILARVLSGVMIFAVIVRRRGLSRIPEAAQWHALLFALFLAVLALSSLRSTGTMHIPVPLWIYPAFFLMFSIVLSDAKLRRPVVWAVVLGAGGSALVAVVQFLILRFGVLAVLSPVVLPGGFQHAESLDLMRSGYIQPHRVLGTLYSPNALGAFLMMVFPFAAWLYTLRKGASGMWVGAWAACAALLMVAVVFLTKSRAAMLGAIVAGTVLYLGVQTRRTLARSVFVAGAAAFVLAMAIISSSSLRDSLRLDTGMSIRPILWNQAMDIIKEKPVLGAGAVGLEGGFMNRFAPGTVTFGNELSKRSGPPSPNFVEHTLSRSKEMGTVYLVNYHLTPHNLYLYLGVQTGLCGLAVLGCFFYPLLRHQIRRIAAGDRRVLPPLAATAAILCASFFDVILFYSIAVTTIFALASAMTFSETVGSRA